MDETKKPISSKTKTIEDYIADSRMFGDVPKDQFGHQFKLWMHPLSPPKSQMDLLPPDAILGIIKDSETLKYFQQENVLLNRFYDMGLRSNGIMELFDSLFYSWWQGLRMTGALGGTERWLQSFLEPTGVPYEGFSYAEKRKMKKLAKKRGGIVSNMVDYARGSGGGEEKIYE
jgi:hypothetical protein